MQKLVTTLNYTIDKETYKIKIQLKHGQKKICLKNTPLPQSKVNWFS